MNLTMRAELRSTAFKHIRACLLVGSLVAVLQPLHGRAQQNLDASSTSLPHNPAEQGGQHDFDFEIGTWKTQLSRLLHPLTGSTTWVEYEGTTVVRKVWNGRANLVELEADGPGVHFEGLNLRLYNPPIPPVEPQFCQQQRRDHEPTHDRRVQEWTRRVLRPGNTQWPSHLCSICYLGHHSKFVPF